MLPDRVTLPSVLALLAVLTAGPAVLAIAAADGASPAPAAAPAGPAAQYVEKTVCVPTMVTEIRKVKTVQCRAETRQRTVTQCVCVPETRSVQHECTVLVPETRTKTVLCCVCKPIYKLVKGEYCLPVFRTEMRPGTKTTCKVQPVPETVTVCVDEGHWEERPCKPCCGCGASDCGGCEKPCTCRVWVPRCVQKEMAVSVLKPVMVEEPVQVPTIVSDCEKRTWSRLEVCGWRTEKEPREVCYTVCVPKKQVTTCQVTTMKTVQVKKVEQYTVMVPHEVVMEVPVTVCKMVPKTIRVPVCTPQ